MKLSTREPFATSSIVLPVTILTQSAARSVSAMVQPAARIDFSCSSLNKSAIRDGVDLVDLTASPSVSNFGGADILGGEKVFLGFDVAGATATAAAAAAAQSLTSLALVATALSMSLLSLPPVDAAAFTLIEWRNDPIRVLLLSQSEESGAGPSVPP